MTKEMTDRQRNRVECRSKEGLEADILFRPLTFGPVGETEDIANCNSDSLSQNSPDEKEEKVPPNFIQVDH